ncbi:serine hydrolase [Telluribacter humicola]|uniref:serine hydrolase n=1 Tax=Telluribacter humicola TaxID=1720261 RepID=UPI001A96827B|nr:serine hydrolase [Telluribacter humicola]
MKKILLLLLLVVSTYAIAQPSLVGKTRTDKELTKKIEAAMRGFEGVVGVYVRHLKTGRVVEIKADTVFPTASMVKIPILCGLFDKIHQGKISYQQTLTYRDSLHYDDGIVGSLRDSAQIPLSYVIMLMTTLSDNTGSLWLQAMAGGGATINQWLDKNGFTYTRVNSRTPGREAARTRYGWGQTTACEMAELMVMIRQGRAISPDISDRMYRYLGRQFWDGESLSQIPSDVKVASKNGTVSQAKSEVVLVHAPHGDYVLCVTTKNQKDERWVRTNAGYELLRTISATVWKHFEPQSTWQPPQGYDKWW